MKTNMANVLDINAYRRSQADDALGVQLSEVIENLSELELDAYTHQAKCQALIHLHEAQDLLSK